MIKPLNWKNIKKQGLRLTASHVTFVFYFHFRATSWWRLLVRLVGFHQILPLRTWATAPEKTASPSRKVANTISDGPDIVLMHSLLHWTTQEASSWRLQLTSCLSLDLSTHQTPSATVPILWAEQSLIVYTACLIKFTMRIITVLGNCMVLNRAFLQALLLLLSLQWTPFYSAVTLCQI